MPEAPSTDDRQGTTPAQAADGADSRIAQVDPTGLRPQHTPPRPLAELAEHLGARLVTDPGSTTITGVTLSTKDVRPGELFVAMTGSRMHGATFAADAVAAGATAVLTDPAGEELSAASGVPVLVLPELRSRLGQVAEWVYRTDAPGLTLYGVTGTNGKTSTVHIMEGFLRILGVTSGLSSTAERHIGDTVVVSGLTTPEAPELHALLARMREEHVTQVALEVSAQAISRHRVDGVVFDVAGFTNLSHDHLDDYGTMTAYADAKAPLFTAARARRAVISLDSEWGREMLDRSEIPTETVAATGPADWAVSVTAETSDGVRFDIDSPSGSHASTGISLLGRQMAGNAGLAIAMLVAGGVDERELFAAIDGVVVPVHAPGRTEKISGDAEVAVYVDFGHSADAFEKTLAAVRAVTSGRTIMVFGADGDRDTLKRPAMARAAVEGSDVLVVTDHHPRMEDPASIRATLVAAAREAAPEQQILEVGDPKQAIREAVKLATSGDSILWAGPGHQNYRDIEGVHVVYSAREEARMALRESGWT